MIMAIIISSKMPGIINCYIEKAYLIGIVRVIAMLAWISLVFDK